MKIERGLMNGQVLQRNAVNVGLAEVEGAANGDGGVEARIRKGARCLKGWNWRTVGKSVAGRFHAGLGPIPVGGPYSVDLRVKAGARISGKCLVREVFVGDVWFMAGQSNMQGSGNMDRAPKPHPMVRCFFMRDEWGIARDPLHQLTEAVDHIHNNGVRCMPAQAERERRNLFRGVGVGVSFGTEMFKRTGVPQGLVACAHGGSTMAQWSPGLKNQGGKSFYGAMFRRFQKLGQPLRGILWYQGESDTGGTDAAVYTDRMNELIAATRADLGLPALPWIIVQISRYVCNGLPAAGWNSIQDQQRRLVDSIANVEVVPAVDVELEDKLHVGAGGFPVLGARMARMADRLALGNRREAGSIRFESIGIGRPVSPADPRKPWFVISFRNVVGGLRSKGLPAGFTLFNAAGEPVNLVCKIRLEGCRAILELTEAYQSAFSLAYGYGLNPHCNITDARDMAIPVFGPVSTGVQSGSAFLVSWQVSGPYEDRKVRTARMPDDGAAWRPPHAVDSHMVLPQDANAAMPGMFYLRTAVEAVTAGMYTLSTGADSPYRIWINGLDAARNLTATNPCWDDEYPHPVEIRAGHNEVIVAFDGRCGAGWGICMRFFSQVKGENLQPDAIVETA